MAPDRIGRYEIQRRLGTGGMGSLYLARDPGLDRLVAIKLLKDDFQDDQDLRERFAREARSVARLRHPNIVIVFDVGEDEGRPFMAMEYIAGETLTHVLRRDPPLPLARRLGLMEELCAGLAHAHGAGIVHRDIKPANLMLDGEGVLKILDFGIARLANSGMTQDGMMMGSVNYMSPEQIVGRGVDHRTDIFATGAVLYEAIALAQAFPGAIDSGVLHSILEKGPIPLDQRVPSVDPELVRIVRQALEREPEKRYDDVNVMRRDIGRVRRRLLEDGHESGADFPHDRTIVARPKTATSGTGRPSDSDRRRKMDPERFAEVQRQQVEEHLRFSREAFAKGDYDAALQHAERAATVDSDSRLAFDLIDQSRFAIEAKAIRQLLSNASRLLSEGRLEDAAALADEASATIPDMEGADELRNEMRRVSDEISAQRERQKRIDASLARARVSIEEGGYETALRAVYEVLALDPERPEARDLEQIAKSRLQAQRQHEQARRSAYDRLKAARTLVDENKFDEAVSAINAVVPPSDTVRLAAAEALTSVRTLQRRRATDAIVAKAQTAFSEGLFEQAVSQIDAIAAEELTDNARSLRTAAVQKLTEQRELVQRRQALEAAIAATQTLISEGSIAKAYERLQDAVGTGLDDERIAALRRQIVDLAAAAEARRREEARERAAAKRVDAARQLFDSGDRHAAVALLERDSSGHGLVAAALTEMRETLEAEEERVRREAALRRQEQEARQQAAIEAARLLELERQAEEKLRRDEERRLEEERRAAQEAAEKKRLADKRQAEEKQRRDEERRLEEERKAAQQAAEAKRLEEERLREAEQREQLRRELVKQLALARERLDQGNLTGASEAATTALTLDPQNSVALKIRNDIEEETQRRDAEAARQEAARKEEVRRQAEEARRRDAEERQRELEARRLEQQVTKILKKVRKVPEHEAALGLLNEALTLAPGDPRVQTLLRERNAALENIRAEEQHRAEAREKAASEEAAQRERERLAREAQAVRERQDREARERREREEREARARHAQEEEAALTAELEARRQADAAATLVVAAPHSPQETALRGAAQEIAGETILRAPRPAPRRANVAYLGVAAGILITAAVGVMLFQGPTPTGPAPGGETPPSTAVAPPVQTPAPTVPTPVLPVPRPVPTVPTPVPTGPTPVPTVPTPVPTVPTPVPTVPTPVPTPVPTAPTPGPTVPTPVPTVPTPVPTPTPVPPVPTPVPTVSPSPNETPPRIDERAAIEQTFRAYEGAWSSLDAEAVHRVQDFTGPDMARVRASMDAARQFQVSVQIQDVSLAADGRHATVTARVRRVLIPKSAARPADTTVTNTFTMEKRGDTWVIVTLK